MNWRGLGKLDAEVILEALDRFEEAYCVSADEGGVDSKFLALAARRRARAQAIRAAIMSRAEGVK